MLLFLISVALGCSNNIDKINIYPIQDEVLSWDLSKLFSKTQNEILQYTVNDALFSIEQPMHQGKSVLHIEGADTLINLVADELNGVWNNRFAFMESDGQNADIYENSQKVFDTPYFDRIHKLDLKGNRKCYDLAFYLGNIIVDCSYPDGTNLANVFYMISEEQITEIPNQNIMMVRQVTKRQILTINNYIIRAYYQTQDSFIELIDQNYQTIAILNKGNLAKYLSDEEVQFNLKQIAVRGSLLYCLDSKLGVFQISLDEFEIIGQHRPSQTEVYYSFDVSYYMRTELEKWEIIMTDVGLYIYEQDQLVQYIGIHMTSAQAFIRLSTYFALVYQRGSTFLINLLTKQILSQDVFEGLDLFLVNPVFPDAIAISRTYSHRFQISTGKLKFKSALTTQIKSAIVIAQSQAEEQCIIQFQYLCITKNDVKIYTSTGQLPTIVSSPSEPFNLQDLASGPNLTYQSTEDINRIEIQQIRQLNSTTVPYIENALSVIIQIDEVSYYHAVQQKNFFMSIYYCVEESCTQVFEIKSEVLLYRTTFDWKSNPLTIAIQTQLKSIEIYQIIQEEFKLINTITIQETEQLIQCQIMDQSVFVLTSRHLFYYPLFTKLDYKIIDQSTTGFEFLARRLYSNYIRRVLVIDIGGKLLICTVHVDVRYIRTLEIDSSYVAVSFGSLLIVNGQQIFEYNIENLFGIYKMKDLPTYNYVLTSLIDSCTTTGYLFVKSNVGVLVYTPNTEAHLALLKVIPLTPSIISVTGTYKILIYTGQLHLLYLLPQITIYADVKDNRYEQDTTISLAIKNNVAGIMISQQIKVINTHYKISLDSDKLRDSNKLYLNNKQLHILNDQWYQGQVIGMSIKLQTKDKILFQNKVALVKGQLFQKISLNSYTPYGEYYLIQGDDCILIMKEDILFKYIGFNTKGYICKQAYPSGNYIYSLCSNNIEDVIHVTQLRDGQYFPLGIKINSRDLGILDISKIAVVNQYLFLLASNPESPLLYEGSFVRYTIQEDFKLVSPLSIFPQLAQPFYFTDFEYSDQRFYVLDAARGLMIYDYPGGEPYYLSNLHGPKIIFKSNTIFTNIKVQGEQVLILTNNVAQYVFKFQFQQLTLQSILNQYGSWGSTNQAIIDSEYVYMIYSNKKNQAAVVYKLKNSQEPLLIEGGVSGYNINFLYSYQNRILLILEDQQLNKYEVKDNYTLFVPEDTHYQTINFTAHNDFNEAEMNFFLDQYYPNDNSNTWWIVLIVVLTTLTLSIALFILYKRRRPRRKYNIQIA